VGSLPLLHLARCSRAEALDSFENTWVLTEILFAAIQGERTFYRPPYHRLRHPMIFYYAHPAVLYVNKLRLVGLGEAVNEDFETLFETGVDEMSWDDLSQTEIDWPPLREVTDYRRTVHALVRDVIESHPGLAAGHAPIGPASPLWALLMGLEHERIHLELSSVLIRELPVERVRRPEGWPAARVSLARTEVDEPAEGRDFPPNPLVPVPACNVALGRAGAAASYAWDNEYGEKHVGVRPFRASTFLVSNGELLAFVRDGGYQEKRFWSEDGWKWRCFRNAKWPTFWVAHGPGALHRFKLRTLFAIEAMPWRAPALVNWHEAHAFCSWRTEREGGHPRYRVLTEGEHHALRDELVPTPSGIAAGALHNLGLSTGGESAVDAHPPTMRGFHDVFGNAWEWCEDHFHPLPGFKVHPLYDDFSTPCFDGKHYLTLGGSFVSTGASASAFARFQFRPHFFQHAGFRLACADDGDDTCDAVVLGSATTSANVYESSALVDQYLLLHYGDAADAMPFAFGPKDAVDFPARTAALAMDVAKRRGIPLARALDLGCGVGRSSFELARLATEVLGVDLSAAFVATANAIKSTGEASFRMHEEGEIVTEAMARVPADIDRARVTFRQADACALPAELAAFDLVLAANLLCRVPSPRAVLARMGGVRGLVRRGGLLVITSPYTWMETFTPRDVWLGGVVRDGREVPTREGLHAHLDAEFELVEQTDLPLIIREHRRKYQYIVSHATVWRRRT